MCQIYGTYDALSPFPEEIFFVVVATYYYILHISNNIIHVKYDRRCLEFESVVVKAEGSMHNKCISLMIFIPLRARF